MTGSAIVSHVYRSAGAYTITAATHAWGNKPGYHVHFSSSGRQPDTIRHLLGIDGEDGSLRLQPCKSPVWDTAYAMFALGESGVPRTDARMAEMARADADLVLIKPISFGQLRDLSSRFRVSGA